jgi:hypothetical protein
LENHFCVEDAASTHMQTYDSGVASLFTIPTVDARDVSVNYVGVVKDIFSLITDRCLYPSSSSDASGQNKETIGGTPLILVTTLASLSSMSDTICQGCQIPSYLRAKQPKSSIPMFPINPGGRSYYVKKHVLKERYSRMQTSSSQHQLRIAVSLLQTKSHLHQVWLLWLGQFSSQHKINCWQCHHTRLQDSSVGINQDVLFSRAALMYRTKQLGNNYALVVQYSLADYNNEVFQSHNHVLRLLYDF